MTQITLITGNQGKATELSRLLGRELAHQKIDLPEPQETDVSKVVEVKARAAYELLGTPVIVDDTGLTITAWGELPGALIKWFMDNVGNEGIIKMLGNTTPTAYVQTALCYYDENGPVVALGTVNGRISEVPRGENGFGYDPIFIPEGGDLTFAEMTDHQKDAVSMRALAAKDLQSKLG